MPGMVSQRLSSPRGAASNGSSKKTRRRVASMAQRRAANIRERRRMFNLNEAFDKLRRKVGFSSLKKGVQCCLINANFDFFVFVQFCLFLSVVFAHARFQHLPTKNDCRASKHFAWPSLTLVLCRKYWRVIRAVRHDLPKFTHKYRITFIIRRRFRGTLCHRTIIMVTVTVMFKHTTTTTTKCIEKCAILKDKNNQCSTQSICEVWKHQSIAGRSVIVKFGSAKSRCFHCVKVYR